MHCQTNGNTPPHFNVQRGIPDRTQNLLFFQESILGLIPGEALGEGGTLIKLAGLQSVQILVGFQLALGDLQHFHRHIGAVVCGALAGGQQIFQYKAVLYGAKFEILYISCKDLVKSMQSENPYPQ